MPLLGLWPQTCRRSNKAYVVGQGYKQTAKYAAFWMSRRCKERERQLNVFTISQVASSWYSKFVQGSTNHLNSKSVWIFNWLAIANWSVGSICRLLETKPTNPSRTDSLIHGFIYLLNLLHSGLQRSAQANTGSRQGYNLDKSRVEQGYRERHIHARNHSQGQFAIPNVSGVYGL